MDAAKVHKFERAGLGRAPYRYLGFEEKVFTVPGAYSKPGGTCQYCGTAIRNCFWVGSADGKRFYVGCECIGKLGDRGLVDVVRREANRMKRDKAAARADERIAAARARLETDAGLRAALAAAPHPTAWRAEQGGTKLEWAEWMLKNAGRTGSLLVVRAIEKL